MKANKKGVSLAFVIVVVLALVILSSLLFTAAARSMSMTGRSTEGRAAYLKAKSAIEYAKTEVYNLAKSNTLDTKAGFSIGPDGDYFQQIPAQTPDGTKCLAECSPAADGKTWKVTAKVKYPGFEQYRQMAYSFTLERNLPASNFIMCGAQDGHSSFFGDGFSPTFYPNYLGNTSDGKSVYPVVETLPVSANCDYGYLSAPEVFFCGMSASFSNYLGGRLVVGSSILCNNFRTTIHSDMIGIAGDISGVSYYLSNRSYLYLQPYTESATGGVIYFNGQNGGTACSVNFVGYDGVKKIVDIPKGYYWFDKGIDLFDLKTDGNGITDSENHKLVPLAEHEAALPADQQTAAKQKNAAYVQDTDYVMANAANMVSGDSLNLFNGLNWAPGGKLGSGVQFGGNLKADDKTVFLYVNHLTARNPIDTTDTYCAKQIFMQLSADPFNILSGTGDLVFPSNHSIVFQADLISINMMKTDTDDGKSAADRPKIVQPRPDEWLGEQPAHFIVKSLNGTDNVTLVFPKDVGVNYYKKSGYTYQPVSYVIPKGTYSVKYGESGFDFFDGKIGDWAKFWSDCRAGAPGGFTIKPGQYSVS